MFIGAAAVCFLFFAVFPVLYKYYKYDNSGVSDAVSSTTDGLECRLTVTANASRIEDRKAFADEIFGCAAQTRSGPSSSRQM